MTVETTVSFAEAPFEIIDGDRGKNYPKKSDFRDSGHCLFLSATNVTKSGFKFSECQFIDQGRDAALNKGKLQRNDVVLTTRGTIGNTAYYNDSVPFDHLRINSGMVIFRCDTSKLLPGYLYHFVRSTDFFSQVDGLRSGAAQPQLPIRDMRRIRLPLPDLPTQRRIAGILSAYDDLIENNLRRIRILEEMAQSLYREWFVHFRYPRDPSEASAKAGGHESVPLVDSPLGPIPDGWEVKKLADVCESVNYGYTASASPKEIGPKFLRITDIVPENIDWDRVPYCEIEDKKRDKFLVQSGDIVVARTGATTGFAKRLNKSHPDSVFASYLVRLRICSDHSNRHFGLLVESDFYKAFIKRNLSGAAQPQANASVITSIEVAVPPRDISRLFDRLVEPLLDQKESLSRRNQTLRQTRDLLLPKLLKSN